MKVWPATHRKIAISLKDAFRTEPSPSEPSPLTSIILQANSLPFSLSTQRLTVELAPLQ